MSTLTKTHTTAISHDMPLLPEGARDREVLRYSLEKAQADLGRKAIDDIIAVPDLIDESGYAQGPGAIIEQLPADGDK